MTICHPISHLDRSLGGTTRPNDARDTIARSSFLRAIAITAIATCSGIGALSAFFHTAATTRTESALMAGLACILLVALTACLTHLAVIEAVSAVACRSRRGSLAFTGAVAILRVLAPRLARTIVVASASAGCAVALIGTEAHATAASPPSSLAETTTARIDDADSEDETLPPLGWGAYSPELESPSESGETQQATIEVQPGDCLWHIARAQLSAPKGDASASEATIARHVAAIAEANPAVSDPDLIYPGMKLTIPPVQAG